MAHLQVPVVERIAAVLRMKDPNRGSFWHGLRSTVVCFSQIERIMDEQPDKCLLAVKNTCKVSITYVVGLAISRMVLRLAKGLPDA